MNHCLARWQLLERNPYPSISQVSNKFLQVQKDMNHYSRWRLPASGRHTIATRTRRISEWLNAQQVWLSASNPHPSLIADYYHKRIQPDSEVSLDLDIKTTTRGAYPKPVLHQSLERHVNSSVQSTSVTRWSPSRPKAHPSNPLKKSQLYCCIYLQLIAFNTSVFAPFHTIGKAVWEGELYQVLQRVWVKVSTFVWVPAKVPETDLKSAAQPGTNKDYTTQH